MHRKDAVKTGDLMPQGGSQNRQPRMLRQPASTQMKMTTAINPHRRSQTKPRVMNEGTAV
eukprot:scaffold6813_cov97-Skeletonema_dohrnii-CCMP3373.AAC.4